MKKLNLTTNMIKFLTFIRDNEGKLGADVPKHLRSTLRTAENMELAIYSERKGWKLTPTGLFQVKE